MPAETIAPVVREYQQQIAHIDVELRAPRAPRPDVGKLRGALEQRAEAWKADLRDEPKVARLLLRRLVGPMTLWEESEGGLRWDAPFRPTRCWMALSNMWRPQRDSNPCFGLERATSWASGRWGRRRALQSSQ
jgi:hypothetical protein